MNDNNMRTAIYILARNEEDNIGKCLSSLANHHLDTFVLDSGSTDNTKSIVDKYPFATLINFNYINHCNSYNLITTQLAKSYDYVFIIDSDITVSSELKNEVFEIMLKTNTKSLVIEAPVEMYVEGIPLDFSSLYPPKPFFFSTGQAYFESIGHAEKIKANFKVTRTLNKISHDDRKPFSRYLSSQIRYSASLVDRYARNEVSIRDRIRCNLPLLILVVPLISYIFRLGFLDGKAGILYAIDRLIAESVMYRQAIAYKLNQKRKKSSR